MVGSGRGKTEASREVERSGEVGLEMSGVGRGVVTPRAEVSRIVPTGPPPPPPTRHMTTRDTISI